MAEPAHENGAVPATELLAPKSTSAVDLGRGRIQRVTTCGVAGLALAGFAMSYEAPNALARDNGVSAGLAWLWPLVVDGFIVVASMSVVRAVIECRRTWHPWALLLLFSTISVAGNVAHGPPTGLGRLVAAVPPVALVLAFDLLMRQVQLTLRPPQVAVAAGAEPGAQAEAAGVSSPVRGLPAGRSHGDVGSRGRAARLVGRARAAGQPVTGRWLADQLSVSEGYARRLLRQIDAAPEAPNHCARIPRHGTDGPGDLD